MVNKASPRDFYLDPGTPSLCKLVSKWWREALGQRNPELYVARRLAEEAKIRKEMEGKADEES